MIRSRTEGAHLPPEALPDSHPGELGGRFGGSWGKHRDVFFEDLDDFVGALVRDARILTNAG